MTLLHLLTFKVLTTDAKIKQRQRGQCGLWMGFLLLHEWLWCVHRIFLYLGAVCSSLMRSI